MRVPLFHLHRHHHPLLIRFGLPVPHIQLLILVMVVVVVPIHCKSANAESLEFVDGSAASSFSPPRPPLTSCRQGRGPSRAPGAAARRRRVAAYDGAIAMVWARSSEEVKVKKRSRTGSENDPT